MKKIHKKLGLILLLPFVCWTVTGVFFFIKPGYQQAYQSLAIKSYPLDTAIGIPDDSSWNEVRLINTILGTHLLVRTGDNWQQLDPKSLRQRAVPNESEVRQLVADAISEDKSRYGEIEFVSNTEVKTSNNIEINLNWSQLQLSQKGPDTNFINLMYKIHYLQWTGIAAFDKFLGIIGLALVLILSLLGTRMALVKNP
ncbi:MAG: hypothetical protein KUG78_08885 [Kangiellaceae bacterium]|nr:hypothetical protein [Kangiellaceae bacterium]